MGRQGPGALPQVEKREQYARLIAQGYNNSEACRIAGINRRTGKRWRHGCTITTRERPEAALCSRGFRWGGQAGPGDLGPVPV
jgi:hypothetical protein